MVSATRLPAVPPDIEIAQSAVLRPIQEIAAGLGLGEDEIELYGRYKAKVNLGVLARLQDHPDGKLILVTGMTATPAGEGKTVTSIGLAQAMGRLGKRHVLCLREPSLGPTFGIKGGAAGGGYSQVLPMDEINLHFTGDIHAVGAAHNLLAALIDNHIYSSNELGLDPTRILWRRVMDISDRYLRNIVIGLGGKLNGYPRESGFDMTVTSEIMACLALCSDMEDLKQRMGRMMVAYKYNGEPVLVRDLGYVGALAVLLKDAIKPNLVQTLEHTPVLIHCGPFANIAHGCNSVLATRIGLKLGDYCITEAGFATDLGAEKFFNIKCRQAGLRPAVAVIVATCRALKMHGGVPLERVREENVFALVSGCVNLRKHIENIRKFGVPPVVALNRFPDDSASELSAVRDFCAQEGVPMAISEVCARGGEGGVDLAQVVLETIERTPARFRPLYEEHLGIKIKIEIIAREIYGAEGVDFAPKAEHAIAALEQYGYDRLPICMAKTQLSLTDDKTRLGAPKGWRLIVQDVRVSNGAGFIVVITGSIVLMPGLPKHPAAEKIDIFPDGRIVGLF